TFHFACEFVKRDPANTAEALDLDPEPLAYGLRKHYPKLKPEQRKRLAIHRRNVISVSKKKVDVIVANNFSFYIFQERAKLVEYFRAARKSLARNGMFILEMVGGPGFVEKNKEQRTIKHLGKPLFTYIWDQRSFNPVDRRALYSIHFRFPDGSIRKDVFTYDWRIWTIPEVRDALREAGFQDTAVFWETSHRGEATGEFVRSEKGSNDWTWLCYVSGLA
ncbi:MAG: class I SAM-dependent methyltransferase, partial [Deltaproteobacteria bacterium]|nr:class I SAM-dependent methyltransferase [Deltaproteobacteria bacterium]